LLRRVSIAAGIAAALWLVLRAAPVAPPHSALLGSMGRGPTVVLVHGLGADANHWLPVARNLARDHRVALVELPGHGISPMMLPFGLEQATLALDRALAEQTNEPVVVVGHSVGGLVAVSEAIHSPERVRALVLVETALAPQLTSAERDSLIADFDHDWEGTLHRVYSGFGRDSLQGEALWAEASQVERVKLRAWIPVALSTDLSAEAADLTMPVLAVLAPHSWEPEERWTDVSRALGYERIPRLRGRRIENCGHFVMLDQPTALASAIREFAAGRDSLVALH